MNRRGYILIVSSGAAYVAYPGTASYAASKAAVEHFANAFRMEIAPLGVAVGSAHMSWIDTPLVRESKEDLATVREMLGLTDAFSGNIRAEMRGRHSSKGSRSESGGSIVRAGSVCCDG